MKIRPKYIIVAMIISIFGLAICGISFNYHAQQIMSAVEAIPKSTTSVEVIRGLDVIPFTTLDQQSAQLLETTCQKMGLSARAYHRILKLSQTIADLQGSESIRKPHIAEALGFRSLIRG